MTETLLIRADASAQIGTGHVMRCLALAQAWQATGGTTHFVCAAVPAGLATRLTAAGGVLHHLHEPPGSSKDAAQTAALAQQLGAAWVVADGYHFGADYQRALKAAGLRLLAIDDYGHAAHYVADLVLNQNIYADEALYPSRAPTTQLLLGTGYALLRREFWPWRGWQRQHAVIGRRVLITLGGADPENVTLTAIHALHRFTDVEAVIVVGANNPNLELLHRAVADLPALRLVQNVEDMPKLMAWADLALSASGSTCWELAFMGLPALLVVIADNQRPGAAGLHHHGVAQSLGWYSELSPEVIAQSLQALRQDASQRELMGQRGRVLVDGMGAKRVVQAMLIHGLQLRRARLDDAQLLWEWTNEPEVRQSSFRSDAIPWEDHLRWFKGKLASSACLQFIALDSTDTPIGQIRFDLEGDTATTAVSLASTHRSRGYSTAIISLGVNELARTTAVATVYALVRVENERSLRAFQRANFVWVGEEVQYGHPAVRLVWQGK